MFFFFFIISSFSARALERLQFVNIFVRKRLRRWRCIVKPQQTQYRDFYATGTFSLHASMVIGTILRLVCFASTHTFEVVPKDEQIVP